MRNGKFTALFVLLVLGLLFGACAKKPVVIGRENPEEEIKKCTKLTDKNRFEEAVECLQVFKTRFPKSEWGIEAEILVGDNYFRKKDFLLAAESYQAFITLHPMHPKTPYAFYKTGLSYLRYSPKAIDRDQEYLPSAISNFQIVLNNYPGNAYEELAAEGLREARTRVAKRHFYIGRFYYRSGEYIAAIPRLQEVAANYKDSGLAEEAFYLICKASIKLGKLDDAKAAFSSLSINYPKSPRIPELEKKLIYTVKKSEGL